jgi:hypothetical protein
LLVVLEEVETPLVAGVQAEAVLVAIELGQDFL